MNACTQVMGVTAHNFPMRTVGRILDGRSSSCQLPLRLSRQLDEEHDEFRTHRPQPTNTAQGKSCTIAPMKSIHKIRSDETIEDAMGRDAEMRRWRRRDFGVTDGCALATDVCM